MPTHEGFMRAICAEPDDDTHRLIYADWLEENGDPDRAEFIRVQIEIARLTENDARVVSLQRREAELLAQRGRTWRAKLPTVDGITWGYFERGFMASLAANTEAALNQHASALFALAPVQTLQLGTIWDTQIFELSFSWFRIGDRGAIEQATEQLASSACLARIKTLDLSGAVIEAAGVARLARSPNLGCLEALFLSSNDMGNDGVGFLATAPVMGQLRKLDLSYNHIDDGGIEVLAASPLVRNLRSLNLTHNDITEKGASALAESTNLAHLKSLEISYNRIDPDAVRVLQDRFGCKPEGQRPQRWIDTLGDLTRVTENMLIPTRNAPPPQRRKKPGRIRRSRKENQGRP